MWYSRLLLLGDAVQWLLCKGLGVCHVQMLRKCWKLELIFRSGTGVEDWYNVLAPLAWLIGLPPFFWQPPPTHTHFTLLIHTLVCHGWLRQSMPAATKHSLGFKHTSRLCVAAWHRITFRPLTHTHTHPHTAQGGKHTGREKERENSFFHLGRLVDAFSWNKPKKRYS